MRAISAMASAFSSRPCARLGAAVEDVAVFKQVGLEGHDLLQAQ